MNDVFVVTRFRCRGPPVAYIQSRSDAVWANQWTGRWTPSSLYSRVSVIAFLGEGRVEFNIWSHRGATWYGSSPAGALDPIENAIAIRNKRPAGRRL